MDPISNHCHCVIYRRNSEGNDVTFGKSLIFNHNDDGKPSVVFFAWTVVTPHERNLQHLLIIQAQLVWINSSLSWENALRCFKRLFRSRLLQFFTRIPFIPTAVSLRASLVHFFHQSQSQLPELRISSSLQSCSICLQNKTDRAAQICSAWRPLLKKTTYKFTSIRKMEFGRLRFFPSGCNPRSIRLGAPTAGPGPSKPSSVY